MNDPTIDILRRQHRARGWWLSHELDGTCDCGHPRRHHDPEDGMCDSADSTKPDVCWCGRRSKENP